MEPKKPQINVAQKNAVLDHLKKYPDKPILKKELCLVCKMDERQVRMAVAELATEGYPVISRSTGGYLYISDAEKIATEIKILSGRRRKIQARIEGLVRAAAGLEKLKNTNTADILAEIERRQKAVGE